MFTTHRVRLGVLFIGACSVGIAGASAQCVKDWIGGEPLPGVNGAVGASLVWDQDGPGGSPPVLVVGGDFTFAGMVSAQRIAAWDGTTWSNPFGGGLNGPVRALAVFNGDLIAAGEFTRAGGDGGPPASSIARWTGAAWVPLGSGIAGSVNALAVFNGRLYAGGIFGSAGGVPATDLASWDGAAWWGVGVSGVDGTVYALSAFNNALYVAGQLTHADGAATSGIARWDGATWSAVGSGVAPADVRSLLVDGGDLYAGGGFTNAGGQTAYGVARWDGSAWSAAGQGLYHRTCIRYSCVNHVLPVRQLARFGSLIYAVIDPGSGGAVQMFKFNGASWTASATLSTVSAEPWATATLTAFNDALYLGGNFAGGTAPPNFAGFDGTQWELSPGINGPINGLTPYANGLAAVGGFTQIDGVPQNHVALWDGAAWHALGDGISIEGHSIAALGGNLYVGAWPGGVYQWDGSTWQTLYGAGAFSGPPTVSTWNNQVIAGAPFAGFGSNGEESDPSAVAAWNGTAWVPLGHAASVATGPGAFASLGASLYAAGYFGPTASIGRFHGAAEWQAVDTFAIGIATSVVAHNGSLYSAATTDAGTGVVARLNGSTWQQLGGEFDVAAAALASANGELYAVGNFATVDGVAVSGLARWDGAAWQPLGSGTDGGSVAALAGLNGAVVAGGQFSSIGGKGYSNFAVYGCPPAAPCPADFNADGSLNPDDLSDYINAYFDTPAGAGADFNADGIVNPDDLSDFINAFFDGCP